mgnify:CR=1 FL=1
MAQIPFNEKAVVDVGPGGPALLPTGGIPQSSAQSNAVKSSAAPVVSAPAPSPAQPVNQSGFTPSGLFINNDGTINFEKSLESAKAKALELQKKASELQSQQNTGTSAGTEKFLVGIALSTTLLRLFMQREDANL